MKHNAPVQLTDKEIDALSNVVTLAIVRAYRDGEKHHDLVTAITKVERSRQRRDIEIPAERLAILESRDE